MSQYEIEHNVPLNSTSTSGSTTQPPPRRPDLSSFFSALDNVSTNRSEPRTGRRLSNPHSIPTPEDVEAVFRLLAEAIHSMGHGGHDEIGSPTPDGLSALQNSMIAELMANARDPPRELNGVPQSFLDGLERVPKKALKKDMDCPICGLPFVEDPYPLVVRLPCDPKHMFDLDCIAPWLKLQPTCPLDRKDLLKKKEPPPKPVDGDDDEEDLDGLYA